jgi:hypothetical protein
LFREKGLRRKGKEDAWEAPKWRETRREGHRERGVGGRKEGGGNNEPKEGLTQGDINIPTTPIFTF